MSQLDFLNVILAVSEPGFDLSPGRLYVFDITLLQLPHVRHLISAWPLYDGSHLLISLTLLKSHITL